MRTSSGSKKIGRDAVSSYRQVIREVVIQNHGEQVNPGPGQNEHSAGNIRKTAILRTSVLSHPPPPYLVILTMGETEFLGTKSSSVPAPDARWEKWGSRGNENCQKKLDRNINHM